MTGRPDRSLVILGDALLDIDLVGDADRLAPDAPVPVVQVGREIGRPGGAGLAALLARRLAGADREVVLVTPLADDPAARRLRGLVEDAGVRVLSLARPAGTPVKRRVRAGQQFLLRLDEGGPAVPEDLTPEAAEAVAGAGAVLVSDYGQGLTSVPGLAELLADTPAPVVWDPHPRGAAPAPGVRLVTPSESEARTLAPDAGRGGRYADLTARAEDMVERWRVHAVAITLGARGALLSHGDGPPIVVPAPAVAAPSDCCGAGDCFAAAAALALARGQLVSEAVGAAVTAAARFVADGGATSVDLGAGADRQAGRDAVQDTGPPAEATAPQDAFGHDSASRVLDRVRAHGGTVVATGGCFDLLHAGHVETLRAARALGDCLVVLVNSDESVRRLKGPTRPIVPVRDRARVLSALDAVDAVVVFDEDTPVHALERVRPDVWAKGGDYSVEQLPEAETLRRWGGQIVVLPYLDGRSTTRLVEHVSTRGG